MCNWPDGFQVTVTNPETRAHFQRSAYFRTMPLTQNDPISAILECVSNCGEFISPGEPMVFTVSVQCAVCVHERVIAAVVERAM